MLTCQKDLFSLPPGKHYLNCAYMSPLSKRVEAAGIEGVRSKTMPGNIVPEDFFSGPDRVRALFAELIGSSEPSRVAIVPSVSYGMGIVARNTTLTSAQNVVTLQDQFPSHMYAWRRLCSESGADLRVVPPPPPPPPTSPPFGTRGAGWNEKLLAAIDGGTAIVAVPQVHWTDGTVFDLDEVGRRARDVGAAFVIDGTQSIGARPFDVGRLQPDAVICAGYKWLGGPYSIGLAYFGPRFDGGVPLEETWIGREGSENFGRLVDYQDSYRPGAVRFDVGEVSNFVLIPMLVAALEQLADWGVDAIGRYCADLTKELIDELEASGFDLTEQEFRSQHLFGIRVPGEYDFESLKNRLAEGGVSVSLRGSAIRVSPHVYNDRDDVDALRKALDL